MTPLVSTGDTLPVAGRLAALARGIGDSMVSRRLAQQKMLADLAQTQMEQGGANLRSFWTNADKLTSVVGTPGYAGAWNRMDPNSLPEGALSSLGPVLNRNDQLRDFNSFANAFKNAGAGASSFTDAGSQPDPHTVMRAEIPGQWTPVLNKNLSDMAAAALNNPKVGGTGYNVIGPKGETAWAEDLTDVPMTAMLKGWPQGSYTWQAAGPSKVAVNGTVPTYPLAPGSAGRSEAPATETTSAAETTQTNTTEPQTTAEAYSILQSGQGFTLPNGVEIVPEGSGSGMFVIRSGGRELGPIPLESVMAILTGQSNGQ